MSLFAYIKGKLFQKFCVFRVQIFESVFNSVMEVCVLLHNTFICDMKDVGDTRFFMKEFFFISRIMFLNTGICLQVLILLQS
jgi:hypothetical protein